MKTTTRIHSTLEHQILEWAINADLFEDVKNEGLSGWSLWDRTGVLTSERLVIAWETPHITKYSDFILQRLQALEKDANDKYSRVAKNLEQRIRRVNEGLLRTRSATKIKTVTAHG